MKLFISFFLIFVALLSHAQDKQILIKAGKFFDSEQKKFLVNQQILVEGNLVKEVGPNISVSKDAVIIDLSRYTVVPGLIDSHTHVMSSHEMESSSSVDNLKMIAIEGDALRVLRGAKRAKTFLDAGITTVKDLGNSGQFLDVALKKAINEGTVEGPRLFVSGPILSAPGGQQSAISKKYQYMVSEEYRIVKDVEDARLAVREHITYGADVIKICADNKTSLSFEQMKAIVETAHRYNKKVTAHGIDEKATWEAIMAGVDGIEHGYLLTDSTLDLMSKKGVYYVPTEFSSTLWKKFGNDENFISRYLESVHKRLESATKKNVKIVAGSDIYYELGFSRGDASKNVLVCYQEAGMKPVDILTAATKTAAQFLGLPDKLGVIKKDAFADIIAVEGDLEKEFAKSIFEVRFVMTNGKVYKDVK